MVSRGEDEGMNAVAEEPRAAAYRTTLAALTEGVAAVPLRDVAIEDLTLDSRAATPGAAFLAVQGRSSHGLAHAAAAVERGAVAVLWEPGPGIEAPVLPAQVVVHAVPQLGRRAGELADRFFRQPSADLRVAGFTGTNGKTTTSYLVRSIIEAAGHTAGLIGTIDYRIGKTVYPAANTTPESLDLQRLLAEMAGGGVSYCVMEVSSHALALGRTDGCEFRAAAFTNLTQDHLDFHETFIERSGNEELIALLKNLRMQSIWHRFSYQYYQEDLEKSFKVHQQILGLYLKKNTRAEKLGALVENHINVARDRFLAYLEEFERS